MDLETPRPSHETELLAAVARSRALHGRWVSPPADPDTYRRFLAALEGERNAAYFLRHRPSGGLAGVVNLNEIVRGLFQSAYLGYYAFEPHAGRGLMTEGLARVVDRAFRELRLHRLEANIQPENAASLALVRRLGFRREGYSPRYLKIAGRWRDHERWALLAEEWERPV